MLLGWKEWLKMLNGLLKIILGIKGCETEKKKEQSQYLFFFFLNIL